MSDIIYTFDYMENLCLHCKKPFIRKRSDHKFCKGGCRAMYHNIRKGNKFTKKIQSDKLKPSRVEVLNPTLRNRNTSKVITQNPNHIIAHLEQHLSYLQNQLFEAQNGTYLLSTLSFGAAGLGVGAIMDEDDAVKKNANTAKGKIMASLIGGAIGLYFDKKRKENIVNQILIDIQTTQNKLKSAQKLKMLFDKYQISKEEEKPTIDLPNGVVTGEQVSQMVFKTMNMSNAYWGYLWGDKIADPFYAIAYGLPSQGKSTFSISFADYFNKNHGKTLFMASEQGIAQSLQGIINRTDSKQLHIDGNPNKKTPDQHIKDINDYNYKLVIIDSATHMNYGFAVIERMRNATPNCSYLVILQSVKDGDFKGDNQWAHNCDIMVNINDGKAQVRKTRFMKMTNEWVDIPTLK